MGTGPGSTADTIRGSGVPIRELRRDARALARSEFEERYGRAFLLLSAAEVSAAPPAITEVRLEGDSLRARAESTAGLSLVVYAVRRNGRSASHLITVGRAPDNDVVVPDVSISRFHAFVKEGNGGRWLMQDAGSTNGTTVNGNSVPRQGHGPPSELASGDDVRLGQVELTFLDSEALVSFALRLER
ncbi:MAG TPA: FHA domain-containing protein [Myxococcota bacterium]|nr:FHA domain-containing protein [Myxococcota bacterium]